MVVTITSIDKVNPRDTKTLEGFPVTFSCDLVEGCAVLISPQDVEVGDSISVETKQEMSSDFKILPDTGSFLMKALIISGDYEVIGRVSFEAAQEVFYVDVDGFTFVLDLQDTKDVAPKQNQWVSFVIHKLVLYDENI
jgi:hypothetical protein